MGCHTEPAAVQIAHALQRLHFFQFFNFFFTIYTTYRKNKKITRPCRKKKLIQFFLYNLHDLPQKKNYTHLPQKTTTRRDNFFVHNLHFSQKRVTMWFPKNNTGALVVPKQVKCAHFEHIVSHFGPSKVT